MTDKNIFLELSWDYLGWEPTKLKFPYLQQDWNQTFMTMINQASANINQKSLCGGGDTILIGPKHLDLILSLEYTKVKDGIMTISTRKVLLDESIIDDKIFVTLANPSDGCTATNLTVAIKILNYD